MKTKIKYLMLLGFLTAGLAGCTTVRSASFTGQDYDEVYQQTILGACQVRLIVYDVNKTTGEIQTQTPGVFGGAYVSINVKEYGTSTTVTVTAPGINSRWPDRLIRSLQQGLTQ